MIRPAFVHFAVMDFPELPSDAEEGGRGGRGKGLWAQRPPEHLTEEENLEQYKKLIVKAITEYPEETTAYCRAIRMTRNNYSEKAILGTIDKILSNGITTD